MHMVSGRPGPRRADGDGRHPSHRGPAGADLLAISRELELVGAFRFNDEIDEAIAALADGSLVVDPVITHEFGIEDTLTAFATAMDASVSKVLLRF